MGQYPYILVEWIEYELSEDKLASGLKLGYYAVRLFKDEMNDEELSIDHDDFSEALQVAASEAIQRGVPILAIPRMEAR